MRATKLITVSTMAVLMLGTSLALGQGGGTASSGLSERNQAMSSARERAISGARGSATTAERRRAISGERGRAMTAERGRVVSGERGTAMTAERGRVIRGERGTVITGERRRAMEPYGGTRGTEAGSNAEQRKRLYDILSARRDIPRAPGVAAGDIRVNAMVTRGVRLAAVPEDIARIYPRFRRDRVFIRGDKVVFVDPMTSRIVAVLRG